MSWKNWLAERLQDQRSRRFCRLLEQNQTLQVLQTFAVDALQCSRREDLLWRLADSVTGPLGLQDCVVYLRDPASGGFAQRAAHGPKNPQGHIIANPLILSAGQGIVGTAGLTRQAQLVADTRSNSRYVEDDRRRLSELAVPILDGDQVLGILDSEHEQLGFFGERHLKIFLQVADIAAQALSKIERSDRLKRQLSQSLELESRYWSLFEGIGAGVAVYDHQGHLLDLNSAAQDILGHSRQQMMGKTLLASCRVANLGEKGIEKARCPVSEALDTGLPVHNFEVGIIREDGERRWLLINALPTLVPQHPVPVGAVLTFTDCTDRKRTAAMNALLKARLDHALGERKAPEASDAHSFNNLLQEILGNAELALARLPESHPARQPLSRAAQAALRGRSQLT